MTDLYRVELAIGAAKELKALPRDAAERVALALLSLEECPRPRGSLKLTGSEAYRVRVGRYRIVYEIRDDVLLVLSSSGSPIGATSTAETAPVVRVVPLFETTPLQDPRRRRRTP